LLLLHGTLTDWLRHMYTAGSTFDKLYVFVAGYRNICASRLRSRWPAPQVSTGNVDGQTPKEKGISRALGSFIDAGFTWESLKWVRELTSMPIVIKGMVLSSSIGCV
jgi:hypothetical protein